MKCKRELCMNEVPKAIEKTMVYCSRDCSPYGHFGLNRTPSDTHAEAARRHMIERRRKQEEKKREGK